MPVSITENIKNVTSLGMTNSTTNLLAVQEVNTSRAMVFGLIVFLIFLLGYYTISVQSPNSKILFL